MSGFILSYLLHKPRFPVEKILKQAIPVVVGVALYSLVVGPFIGSLTSRAA